MKKNDKLCEIPHTFRLTENNDLFLKDTALWKVFKGNMSDVARCVFEFASANIKQFEKFALEQRRKDEDSGMK